MMTTWRLLPGEMQDRTGARPIEEAKDTDDQERQGDTVVEV